MRIDAITLHHVKMPLKSPFQTSRWTEHNREAILIEARAEGLTGWGECVAGAIPNYSYESIGTAWHVLRDFLIPMVREADLADSPTYHAVVEAISGHNMAKAGLELAIWDLFAQRAGRSLQQMWGGSGSRVRTGVSVGIQPSPEHLLETVRGYVADGYQRVKLKIKPGRDVSECAIIRTHFPDLLLQGDGNSVYRIGDSEHLKALDAFDLLLLEQPLGMDDIIDHAKLQLQLKTPVCLDESIHSLDHARWAIELKACRIINIKPGRVGGYWIGKHIHDLCQANGIPVWMGGMLETGIGRAANLALASLPNFSLPGDISASARYFHEDLITEPFTLNRDDSTLSVPTGAGLGVSVARKVLEKYTLSSLTT